MITLRQWHEQRGKDPYGPHADAHREAAELLAEIEAAFPREAGENPALEALRTPFMPE